MVNSKDKTNQRFIDILRMQHAKRYGVKIGFKGLNLSKDKPNNQAESINEEGKENSNIND